MEARKINDFSESLNNWPASKWQKSQCGYGFVQHWTGNGRTNYDPLWHHVNMQRTLTNQQTLKQPKSAQLDNALHDWFAAGHLEGKGSDWTYDDCLQTENIERVCDAPEPAAEGDVQMEYYSD
jgi:hypothetical protein